MEVRIRPAVADDAPFLGWVIFTAGRSHCPRGLWDVLLARPEDQCLAILERLTVTEEPHAFHHTGFIVAEVDGRRAAALSGYDPAVSGLEMVGPAFGELAQDGVLSGGPVVDNQRGAAAVRYCVPEEAEGAWVIESVATVPEFRRRGIIDTLLNEILEKGRGLGYGLGQVGVFIGNTAAQRAYEKCGFRIVDEKRHPDFQTEIGCPGIARLHLNL